jgi:hypothetical protein
MFGPDQSKNSAAVEKKFGRTQLLLKEANSNIVIFFTKVPA